MNITLPTYSSTTLAAGALHQMITEDKKILKNIYTILPKGTQVAIDLFVMTDSLSNYNSKFYHAATVSITKSENLKVSASIASYIDREYKSEIDDQEGNTTSLQIAVDDPLPSDQKVKLSYYPISEHYSKYFNKHKDEDFNNYTNIIAKSVYDIFLKKGVPLPIDQRVHYSTFSVQVKIPDNKIEVLSFHRGTRGLEEDRTIEHPWSTVYISVRGDEQEFKSLIGASKGKCRHPNVPNSAELISNKTITGSVSHQNNELSLDNNIHSKKIKEIKN